MSNDSWDTMNLEGFLVPLEKMAHRLTRNFPSHILDKEDFIQEGWGGILSVKYGSGEQGENSFSRCCNAAWYRMIDAMRRFREVRSADRGVRRLEKLIPDVDDYAVNYLNISDIEEYIDRKNFIQFLPKKKRKVLNLLFEGYTLTEIGHELDLTIGRICQIKIEIRDGLLKT